MSEADADREARRQMAVLKTKERLARMRYISNPPRWSLQWWKNLARRVKNRISRRIESLFLRMFRRVWDAYFRERYWYKRTMDANAEVAALHYLRKHSIVPVPRVYFSCRLKRVTWLFMDRVDGVVLHDVLVQSSQDQRESYIRQLADILAELRSLQSPFGSMICSASGSYVMVADTLGVAPRGKYSCEDEFNKAICMPDCLSLPPSALCHDIAHPIVFTHGDLAPRNIMVKDGRIVAIIDWETAGWFPASWEYIQTYWANWEERGQEACNIFYSYVPQIMPSYPRELEANKTYVMR